jgi:hypothetical protein
MILESMIRSVVSVERRMDQTEPLPVDSIEAATLSMIEPMLEAERTPCRRPDRPSSSSRVVTAYPGNAIAIVRPATGRAQRTTSGRRIWKPGRLRHRPDNPMASHLAMRMAEIMRGRGEALPEVPGGPAAEAPKPAAPPSSQAEPPATGLVDRLLRRRR